MKRYEQPSVEIIIFDEFVATLDVGNSNGGMEPYNNTPLNEQSSVEDI